MIRIDRPAPLAGTNGGSAARRNSGAGFSLPTREGTAAARTAAPVAAGSLDGLLAVQAEEDSGQRKRRQARRGHDLLDGLDALKAALLAGRVDAGRLAQLAEALSSRRESTDDPRLDEVLAHIELRAAVELAKLGR